MIMTYVIVAMTTFLQCSRQKFVLIMNSDLSVIDRRHMDIQLIFNSVHLLSDLKYPFW